MEFEDVLPDSKWNLLKELSKGSRSASELARKTGMTTANATVQLKLLEAKGIIRKSRPEKSKKAGKPRKPYEVQDTIVMAGILRSGMAERRLVSGKVLGDFEKFTLATLMMMEPEQAYAVNKFCLETGMLKKAELIGLLKAEGNEIELFIITDTHLAEIRQHHSNASIEALTGKTKKIISWSHNSKEVEEGLQRGEEYFLNLVKSQELLDKKALLREWAR